MKEIITILMITIIALTAASCSESSDSKANSGSNSVKDVLNQQTKSEAKEETKSVSKAKTNSSDKPEAEVDLTELNSTMVYSEVYHMMSEPKKYIGKTVRMSGTTDVFKDKGNTYYSCIIKDAAACCAQGIEFVLEDGAEYPESDDEVTVYGKFDTYKEGVYQYCRLINAKLES